MRKWLVLSLVLLCTACSNGKGDNKTAESDIDTEVTTDNISAPALSANAETLTAYGQVLNNACVYLNENYGDSITGDLRAEYDAICQRLHQINLQGTSAYAQMTREERNHIFSQLEEIEAGIFDSVAEKIGVKAELTEAITTTADKKAGSQASGEAITAPQSETTTAAERITAAE